LLFDENLSPRLPALLVDEFPGSRHVRDVGLRGTTDQDIWNFAGAADFTIVTKDDDFRGLSLLRGAPPKVIWLVIGNCTTWRRGLAAFRCASAAVVWPTRKGAA
jgi:predicted nuclease of predicted toxin-antitoxin system